MNIQDQINILKAMKANSFALSLATQFEKYGLSDKQMFWVDKLVKEAIEGPVEVVTIDLANVAQLFDNVTLKYPKIRLMVDGIKLQLSRTGNRSRFPGSINITDGRPYGDNTWYGRIVDGEFTPSKSCTDQVIEILKSLDSDPVEVMANHGHRNGECGFCGKELTDERSTEVGYGPVCAKSWNLPWGSVAKTQTEEVAA